MSFPVGWHYFTKKCGGNERNKILVKPAIPKTRKSRSQQQQSSLILSNEIISLIIELVQLDSPKSLSSLALVNLHFYRLTRYVQFRELRLDLDKPSDPKKDDDDLLGPWKNYLEKADLFPAVRSLRIVGNTKNALSGISTLLPTLTGLTDIFWDARIVIDEGLLEHLRERPLVRLHTGRVEHHNRDVEPSPESSFLLQLQHCTNLTSLEIVHTFTNADGCLYVTKPLRRILLSCPNLRRLKLDIGLPTGGCVGFGPLQEYCGVGFSDGERPLAALEELELVRYPFGLPPPFIFYSRGYPATVLEKDYWIETFDWSRLRCLSLPGENSTLAVKWMPWLTSSIREVSLQGARPNDLQAFFGQIPTVLGAITISKIADIDLESILRHGSALRKLKIHQPERFSQRAAADGIWAQEAVGLDALQAIRDACPLIEDLSLNLSRDGTWPYQAFDILASFPRLHRLELWFELGVRSPSKPVRPYVTFHSAADIYRYLLAKSARKPPCLRTIHIHSGAPAPMGLGFPSPLAFWPGDNSTSFVCHLSDRDDESARAVFSTTCTRVSDSGNKFLRETEPGWDEEELERKWRHLTKTLRDTLSIIPIKPRRQQLLSINHHQDFKSIRLAYMGPSNF